MRIVILSVVCSLAVYVAWTLFSEYLLSSAGLNDMGAALAVITMGAFIMYQLRGKKEEVAGISGFCRGCFLYTSRNIPIGYYVLFSLSSFRRALRNWRVKRITVPVTAMTSATGSARNTARVWSASRWGSR